MAEPGLARRTLLVRSLAGAGLFSLAPAVVWAAASRLAVANITGLYTVEVARIEAPSTVEALSAVVRGWPGKVAVGGGRYSMGGQVAVRAGLHIDMRAMNRLVWIRPAERVVRVQAGMRWRELQDVLDPLNLAVKTMQSYANFTVGGSVSVNVHGRYVGHGPIANTVRALRLVLADGTVVEASRDQNAELFRAAIGGYGAVGVIAEIELDVADNVPIERSVVDVPLGRYVAHFEEAVLNNPGSVLHNADLFPPRFDAPVAVTWRKTTKPLTETARLVPRGQSYSLEQNALWAMTELPAGERLRKAVIEPLRGRRRIVTMLNHEASLDVAELEPRTRRYSTYVLQEYFVPKRHFLGFATAMVATLRRFEVEALNISIRHAPADTVSLLPWAREDVFAFVLFHKQRNHAAALETVGRWTRELIDAVLDHDGRYYLPYQLHATRGQFERAYPEVASLRRVKNEVDPESKFSNELWARYL